MSKKQGELVELRFYLTAYEKGWVVSKPFGDNAKYDFIVDADGKLSRVQVKSTLVLDRGNRQNRYALVAASGCKNKIAYSNTTIDFLAIYIIPAETWYIIPIEEVEGKKKLHFRPFDSASTGKYEKFKSAWELFKK